MSDNWTVEALNEALNEGGRKITWREIERVEYDKLRSAQDAFQDRFVENNPGVARWHAYSADGYPQREDYLIIPPRATDKVWGEGEHDEEAPGYDEFKEILDASKEFGVDIEGIGTAYFVEDFGGEGQGDQYWYVFKVVSTQLARSGDAVYPKVYSEVKTERHFKVDGYYASYDGGYYDSIHEVFPKQVTRTEWSQS